MRENERKFMGHKWEIIRKKINENMRLNSVNSRS